jgi:hypothetical protein
MKLSIIPATFLTAGLLLALFSRGDPESETAPPPPGCSLWEVCSIQQEGERLEEVRQAVLRFHQELRRLKTALLDGATSLPEAADGVIEAARRDNPSFSKWAALRFPDLPPREQVICLLLDHLTIAEKTGDLSRQQSERLARLRREYEDATEGRQP